MSARSLVIGFDGADLEVVLALGRARLPELFALMDRGVFAHQQSVLPPATLPNWTTFLTAQDPGQHGVFDFTVRARLLRAFRAGTVREAPTWIARLDRLGMRCACVGFPATWPPERLEHGVFISGWDAPVAFEADASFVWPRDAVRHADASLLRAALRRGGSVSRGCPGLSRGARCESGRQDRGPHRARQLLARDATLGCVRVLLRRERHGVALPLEPARRGLAAASRRR